LREGRRESGKSRKGGKRVQSRPLRLLVRFQADSLFLSGKTPKMTLFALLYPDFLLLLVKVGQQALHMVAAQHKQSVG